MPLRMQCLQRFQCQTQKKLLIGLVYRSPGSTEAANDELCTIVKQFGVSGNCDKLLLGDFNFPEIDWETESCHKGLNHPASKFLEATRDAFLIQHQHQPTRHRFGQQSNVLDLVFTSEEDTIPFVETTAGIGKSDHCTLICI